mmetsp:Transcript_21354/g.61783  ORF Transcript_21354/g.61783 Transcript_21354/m.61783 type:complete len:302 (+) Transcript_21354:1909-2814(+)
MGAARAAWAMRLCQAPKRSSPGCRRSSTALSRRRLRGTARRRSPIASWLSRACAPSTRRCGTSSRGGGTRCRSSARSAVPAWRGSLSHRRRRRPARALQSAAASGARTLRARPSCCTARIRPPPWQSSTPPSRSTLLASLQAPCSAQGSTWQKPHPRQTSMPGMMPAVSIRGSMPCWSVEPFWADPVSSRTPETTRRGSLPAAMTSSSATARRPLAHTGSSSSSTRAPCTPSTRCSTGARARPPGPPPWRRPQCTRWAAAQAPARARGGSGRAARAASGTPSPQTWPPSSARPRRQRPKSR